MEKNERREGNISEMQIKAVPNSQLCFCNMEQNSQVTGMYVADTRPDRATVAEFVQNQLQSVDI